MGKILYYESNYVPEDELYHYGRKGMRWYQNIFTKGKNAIAKRKKAAADKKAAEEKKRKEAEAETIEQKRARLLKSANAKEIYENRHLLTRNELEDRINRINTEKRLADLASSSEPKKKTVQDRLDEAAKGTAKITEIANNVNNNPMFKALKKHLLGKTGEKYGVDVGKLVKDMDKMSDDALNKALRRVNTQEAIKKKAREAQAEAEQKARDKKLFDQYNNPDPTKREGYKSPITDGQYHMKFNTKASDVSSSSSTSTGKRFLLGEHIPTVTGEVIGKGTSSSKYANSNWRDSAVDVVATPVSETRSSSSTALGRTYISGLLPAPKDDDD